MRIAPIAARLAGLGFKYVGGALEFAALKYEPSRLPAVFVVPTGWRAEPSRMTQIIDQKIADSFAVVMVFNAAVRAGAKTISEDLETMEAAVIDRLLAWTHPDASMPITVSGAQLISADGTTLAWKIDFSSSHHLRKAG